jgi:hypothetical protein
LLWRVVMTERQEHDIAGSRHRWAAEIEDG